MKRNNVFWIFIGVGIVLLMLMVVVGNILIIGDKLEKINEWLPIAFYILAALLVYLLIIDPILVIAFSPSFCVPTTLEKETRKVKKTYIKVAKNLLKDKDLNDNSIENLKNGLKNKNTLKLELNKVYNNDIKKEINKIILKNAKTVMISTSLSQNSKLDMWTTLTVNIKMIKEITEKCGFRPSYKNLAKLAINTLGTALIAEGLEELDFNELFPNTSINILNEVPILKTVVSSAAQGVSNAFLTLRIGIITRKFLFSDSPIKSKKQIRIEAIKESVMLIPSVIKSGFKHYPDKIKDLFIKKNKNIKETEV